MKKCTVCKKPHKGQTPHCRTCHASYMRAWRKVHVMNDEQKRRDIARSIANQYKKRGHIKPEPCRVCGSKDAEMHHPDYELPRSVVWLCRRCHVDWHTIWRQTVLFTFDNWLKRVCKMDKAA